LFIVTAWSGGEAIATSFPKRVLLLAFTVTILLSVTSDNVGASYSAVVSVYPRESAVKVGQTFMIDIFVENVSGLQGFDFCLKYPTSLLNVSKIEEGSFMNSFGPTFVVKMEADPNYQLYRGRVWVVIVIYGDGFADGSGTLARITFNATSEGSGELDLFSVNPYDSNHVKLVTCQPVAISHSVSDGFVVSSDPDDPPSGQSQDSPPDPPRTPNEKSPDVNDDGKVDILDLSIVSKAFGQVNGDPAYSASVDFDENGVIDILDITVVATKFHQIL
jgi:hypothetical protein